MVNTRMVRLLVALVFLCFPGFLIADDSKEILRETFYYSGKIESWVVPPGISLVQIEVCGARSCHLNPSLSAAELTIGDFNLQGGQKLFFLVGQEGRFDFYDLSVSHGGSSFVILDNGDNELGEGDLPLLGAKGGLGYFGLMPGSNSIGNLQGEENSSSFNLSTYQRNNFSYQGQGKIIFRALQKPDHGLDNLAIAFSGNREELEAFLEWTYLEPDEEENQIQNYYITIEYGGDPLRLIETDLMEPSFIGGGPRFQYPLSIGFPEPGKSIATRLHFFTEKNGWEFQDAFFHFVSQGGDAPEFLPFSSGSALTSTSCHLKWKPGDGKLFYLTAGKSPGAMDYLLSPFFDSTTSSYDIHQLPQDGSYLYFRLYYLIPSQEWRYLDMVCISEKPFK